VNNLSNKEISPIVLFTGAGASCADGINLPNMTQFFKKIMNADHTPKHQFLKNSEYFKYIMDKIYQDPESSVYDLERVLGTLYKVSGTFSDDDAFNIFNEDTLTSLITDAITSTVQSNHNLRPYENNIKTAVKNTITNRYAEIKYAAYEVLLQLQMVIKQTYHNVDEKGIYKVYGNLFGDLLRIVRNFSFLEKNSQIVLPIFTTNYDPSIDFVLQPSASKTCIEEHEKWRNSGIPRFMFTDGFMPHEYGSYFVWRQEAFSRECENGVVIPYHKLHGSVIWEKLGDEIMKTTDPVSELAEMPRKFTLIYPSDKTTPDEDPYDFSHRELEKYLSVAKIFIVIGFAFRDPGLVNIFKRALRLNTELKIIVIGPEPNEWEKEFSQFLNIPNVEHIDGYFGKEEIHLRLMEYLENNLHAATTNK
jgi:hypothetical protein